MHKNNPRLWCKQCMFQCPSMTLQGHCTAWMAKKTQASSWKNWPDCLLFLNFKNTEDSQKNPACCFSCVGMCEKVCCWWWCLWIGLCGGLFKEKHVFQPHTFYWTLSCGWIWGKLPPRPLEKNFLTRYDICALKVLAQTQIHYPPVWNKGDG